MKKTLITLLALAGVAAAETDAVTLSPITTISGYNIETSEIALSTTIDTNWSALDGKINATGFTLQITLSDWKAVKGPLFYLSTSADTPSGNDKEDYKKSLVTFGYTDANNVANWKGATLFNSNGGSANSGGVTYSTINATNLTSHSDLSNGAIPGEMAFFITGEGGRITLYEVGKNSELVKICTTTNVATGTAERIVFSQWANNAVNTNTAKMNLSVYGSVLTEQQMTALIPEPTTATLSLLALAGLAARRRRR